MSKIVNTSPPSLPLAQPAFDQQYQAQLNNILRLYFNQLSDALNTLITTANTNATIYTVATLPTASTANMGTKTYVSDAASPAFGSAVVGGGTVRLNGKL